MIETHARVRHVARHGIDKVVRRERGGHPFALTIEGAGGARIDFARAVIDASGTWHNPNPLGATGTPAIGEAAARTASPTAFPTCWARARDLCGPARAGDRRRTFGGQRAARPRAARRQRAGHALIWAVRSATLARVFGGGKADRLPGRGKLGTDLKQLVESGRLQVVLSFLGCAGRRDRPGMKVSGQGAAGRSRSARSTASSWRPACGRTLP